MSTDPRFMPIVDELDDLPFDHRLRIPPLQDPLPFFPLQRPHPLEPNARGNDGTHNATAKLTSRRSILVEPKLMERSDSTSPYDVVSKTGKSASQEASESSRKRQKLGADGLAMDFVQLPKPIAKAMMDMPATFKLVPFLNELHEPPPSAALFPPITPNTSQETAGRPLREAPMQKSLSTKHRERSKSLNAASLDPESNGTKTRTYLRTRRNWTTEETDHLLKGVDIYGVGKWKKILHHAGFSFHKDRTTVDLKDRHRTVRLMEEKVMENPAGNDLEDFKHDGIQRRPQLRSTKKMNRWEDPEHNRITRKIAPRWSKEEDIGLSEGYRLYGFQWTTIAKDPELGLLHRTGAQVRDRFRLRFPDHYQSSVPVSLTETPKLIAIPHPCAKSTDLPLSTKSSEEQQAPSSVEIPRAAPEFTAPPKSSHAQKPNQARRSPPALPDDKKVGDKMRSRQAMTEEGRRQSSSPTEDVRHLGILGLLNDDEDGDEAQVDRLPALKFPYDDWGSNVTLPPLMWEDLATRPIFDLE